MRVTLYGLMLALAALALLGLFTEPSSNNEHQSANIGVPKYRAINVSGTACIDGWEVRILGRRAIYARDDKFQPIPCSENSLVE